MPLLERLYNANPSRVELAQREKFCELISKIRIVDARALSFSTGCGIWDYFAATNNRGISAIHATDVVRGGVSERSRRLLLTEVNWEFVMLEKECELPFEEKSFDLVYHNDVLEHVKFPYFALQEQYRILKVGGTILFSTPNIFRIGNIARLCFGHLSFPQTIGVDPQLGELIHEQEFSQWQLENLMKEIGFSEIEVHHSFLVSVNGCQFTLKNLREK